MEIQREAIIEIVGTQYEGRALNHRDLIYQQNLIVKHQSDNIHDHNAVVVFTDDGKELGFLPKGYASLYAPAIDSGRYSFNVEIVKSEPDPERPILIVKITSELKNHSEEDIERDILTFIQNIVNGYALERTEYLSFIYSEKVNVDELLSALNNVRLLQKLNSCSSEIIKNRGVERTDAKYTPLTKESLAKYLGDLKSDVNDVLKIIQKAYNESLDIDDEEEYHRVQSDIRERRKKFRSYNDLLSSFLNAVENYDNISFSTTPTVPVVQAAEPPKSADEKNDTLPITELATRELEHEAAIPKETTLTEKAFFDWLISNGGVSDTTAKQYISNIHSIEKLYQTLFGVRKNILGAASADNAKTIIEALLQRSEYIDANERRHNSFSASLNKFAQFAGISVEGLKNSAEKKNYNRLSPPTLEQTTESSESTVPESSVSTMASLPVDDVEKAVGNSFKQRLINVSDLASAAAEIYYSSVNTSEQIERGPQEAFQAEQASVKKDNTPAVAHFVPDTSKPFVLKDAVIEILSSDAPEITKYREYKNGISSKNLRELLKAYYGKTIGIFEISKLLMLDKTFQSVGKGCYILNAAMIPRKIAEKKNIEPASPTIEEHIEKVAKAIHDDYSPVSNEEVDTADTQNGEGLTIDSILDVIKENSGNLQYEDGFGSYEVKTLLTHKGITNVTEEQIEALMSECTELREIEDGYYSLIEEVSLNESKPEPTADVEGIFKIIADTSPQKPQAVNANAGHIVLKLNGSEVRAYDYSDALSKVCEFSINCKPFKMARIAGQAIQLHGNNVFYRKAVPVDGYNKLSNDLQLITISSLSDLQTITKEIQKYCQISDDMITIINR